MGKEIGISEYQFMRLLLSTMKIQNCNFIFLNHDLEKDLGRYFDEPEYQMLFSCFNKMIDIDEKEYIDMNEAFFAAYSMGLLALLRDNNRGVKSANLLSKDDAFKTISEFPIIYSEAMDSLCNRAVLEKGVYNPKRYILINK